MASSSVLKTRLAGTVWWFSGAVSKGAPLDRQPCSRFCPPNHGTTISRILKFEFKVETFGSRRKNHWMFSEICIQGAPFLHTCEGKEIRRFEPRGLNSGRDTFSTSKLGQSWSSIWLRRWPPPLVLSRSVA